MKTTLQNQFEHEHKAWERSLEFFRQENALLKYRLSEMVDENGENEFLQMAEYFQNELLIKDEKLNTLIKNLNEFAGKFGAMRNQNNLPERVIAKHYKLRNDILQFEKNFLHLSKEFNERLLQSISH